uniref:NADH dehydrogenase subunit 6 n=1 Tax=Nephotettix nigropictus TaxID=1563985 RepID=UPI0021D52331|nr:NADH dehydrogenase subunit 6 [Nephotettix nigropictus]UXD78688.1 NADH dehydrogenase subunit 6 [Nephotettix nigropictus]
MKLMCMKIIMASSTTLMFFKTPMSMGVLLLIQTISSTLILAKIMDSSWMPMIVFLMFIGGLLILFMYMSSIASNEKFTPNIMIFLLFMVIMILPFEEMLTEMQMENSLSNFISKESISMIKIYNQKTMMVTILMFMYMFLTMVVVTKIIKIYKGPLRSK